jgi:hypothetical protein
MNTQASVRSAPRRVCARCGASYAEADWVRLEVSERIAAGEVRRMVLDWPEALCVEVRRCGRCGHAIAAKRLVPIA